MQRLEVESKFELSAEGFECLKHLGRIHQREDQLNVYYDAQWLLADNSVTLRIRFIRGGDPLLTLKIPVSHAGYQRVMREFELRLPAHSAAPFHSPRPISIDIDRDLPEQWRKHLLGLQVRQVYRVGWVRNTRLLLSIDALGQLELDRLELPDGSVVYEAEIETNSQSAQERLVELVRRHVPDAAPCAISKFQRFRQAATHALRAATAAAVSNR